mmetsp:Transcript_10454/g.26342  ORF Transcript_10454/g.26342 Transcript_10454/m.26342 type:complete len:365 (+) Transcript_10454:190-1284(+)
MHKGRKRNIVKVKGLVAILQVHSCRVILLSALLFSFPPSISSLPSLLVQQQQGLSYREIASNKRETPFRLRSLWNTTRMTNSNPNEPKVIIDGIHKFQMSPVRAARDSTDTDDSGLGLHRRRTIYLIRHGEAEHNVLEHKAQQKAKEEAEALNLSPEETYERMEDARKSVLNDASLRDAKLTDKGREQAREASKHLRELIDSGKIHHPTEAMCSPLSRCLETCDILMEDADFKAHIRPEIAERRTQYPPDKPLPLHQLLRATRDDDRFTIGHIEKLSPECASDEAKVRESKEMLRERANDMFDLLMECKHRHVLVVSHKGFLRELERGLLEMPESPLFENCELRVYRLVFTLGTRELFHIERIA